MKLDWLYAVVGGLIGVGAMVVLLDVPASDGQPRPVGGAALQVAWEGERPEPSVAAEARLRDPSALFLPSALTAANHASVMAGNAAAFSQLAWREPPEFAFHATDLRLALPPSLAIPASVADTLQFHPPGNPIYGFGRRDLAPRRLPSRVGWIEVTNMASGRVELSRELPPSADILGSPDSRRPESFFVSVAGDGAVGEPVPAGDTPMPSAAFENQLDAALAAGHRLEAGFYRVSVGP